MPIVFPSTYKCPGFLANGHVQTIWPVIFRRVRDVSYERERIFTADGDLLDLDWVRKGAKRLAILSHGLEGDSRRPYMLGMAKVLRNGGWDVLAWNARGCSGECNRILRFTHSGATEDLGAVISHVLASSFYEKIALVGFSLGGNLTLKYLGERGAKLDGRIQGAVAFSVPCDLQASSKELAKPMNRIYMSRFLSSLRKKIQAMASRMPGTIDDRGYERLKSFKDFDDRYTAPIHGFKDAKDYWARSSCKQFLRGICIQTLLINARNDPFLAQECYPTKEAEENPMLHLEVPWAGGHVGFMEVNNQRQYWSETRGVEFLNSVCGI